MKFGRIVYRYEDVRGESEGLVFSYGDIIQTLAVDYMYQRMGIERKDIIDVNFSNMKEYDGEYVILPLCGYASHYKRFNQLPTSAKIIPFIFSFEMSDETCDDLIPFLKKNEPIGCRDEFTMNLLRRKGIEAYISGCLTVTFPKRNETPENGKVFLVDVSSKLDKYIPKEIKEKSEKICHEGNITEKIMTESQRQEIERQTILLMKRYYNEASLVVTSRLHAAAPCMAMGIPVILAIDNIDGRFSFLDKLLPIYDLNDYDKIDWEPLPVYYEELKEQMFRVFETNMLRLYKMKQEICDLSSYWETRDKAFYDRRLYEKVVKLREKYNSDDKFNYIIWGIGVHGKRAYSMMKELFPKAILVGVVDKYYEGEIGNVSTIKTSEVKEKLGNFDYALITTHLGRMEAVEEMKRRNKEIGRDYCYFISKDIPEEI